MKRHTTGKNVLTMFAVLALAGTAASGTARAEFVPGFKGHTLLADHLISDAVINFAVYRVTDADFRDDPAFVLGAGTIFDGFAAGTGSGGLDLGAKFVFFFQVANVNLPPPTGTDPEGRIRQVDFPEGAGYSSWGFLRDIVFSDESGQVTHTNSLGATAEPTVTDTPGDGTPTFAGASDPGFLHIDPTPNPDHVKNPDFVFPSAGFLIAQWELGNAIPTASGPRSSSIIIATAGADGLSYGIARTLDSEPLNFSHGDVPHPNPEPASLVLLSLGLPGLCLARRRRA